MKTHFLLPTLIAGFLLCVLIPVPAEGAGVCGTWQFVPSQQPSSSFSEFVAVASVSPQDAWAVGFQLNAQSIPQTLAEHWDGNSWRIVTTPNVGSSSNVLRGVVAFASNDVWAAGFSSDFGKPQPLVLHWDGSSWQVVPAPTNPGGAYLNSIASLSPTDMWAVGGQGGVAPNPNIMSLAMHWDGSKWSVVRSPNIADRWNELIGVSAVSASDVWAVGTARNVGGNYTSFALHWDGSSWSVVPSPSEGLFTELFNVTALGSSDVWATGIGADPNVNAAPYFLHWNGSGWNQVVSPGGVQLFLGGRNGLAAFATDDIWSVGDTIVHWDGTSWSLAPAGPVPGATSSSFLGAGKTGTCDVWAVGNFSNGTSTFPLVERLQSAVVLSSLTLNPAKVQGGNPSTGTVTLSGPAPDPGVKVKLHSSNTAVATVPPSVTVPTGSTSADFTVSTQKVVVRTKVRIAATFAGVKKVAVLVVKP